MFPSALESDFSVIVGGPLYQAFRRGHLSGDALQLVHRRVLAFVALTWLPLLLLAMVDGTAWGDAVRVPFVVDVDTQVRFLVALPLLVFAEVVVHRRMRKVVEQFLTLGLVTDAVRARFDAALQGAMRLRNSVLAEVLLLVFVYTVGRSVAWDHFAALGAPTWYATPERGSMQPLLAGWWYFAVSLPLFQFVLLRWYFRLFIWARFLWQVARIELALVPMHPDRLGGLGFLTGISHAFAPLLLAQGALYAGTLANRIFFDGAVLTAFKLEAFAFVAMAVAAVLAPQLVFVLPLSRARREGTRRYGHLAKRYIDEFEDKWFGRAEAGEPLIGSADVQSLADMAGSFDVVREMRVLPISRDGVLRLALVTLLPLAPLLLTMISLEELLGKLLQIVF